jgi:hypothetical protein
MMIRILVVNEKKYSLVFGCRRVEYALIYRNEDVVSGIYDGIY